MAFIAPGRKEWARIAWAENDLVAFNEELNDLLDEERSKGGNANISKKLVDKAQLALDRMTDHHYDLKNMYEIEHRQIDEIDEIRDKLKASQAVTDHLTDVRKELEGIVADLRGQLAFSQNESADRKAHIEKQDETLNSMKADAKTEKDSFMDKYKELEAKKDAEINKQKEELKDLEDQANKMKGAVMAAEKGTTALKSALNMCSETLQDAL